MRNKYVHYWWQEKGLVWSAVSFASLYAALDQTLNLNDLENADKIAVELARRTNFHSDCL